jgi:hypothetical protein
MAFTIAWGARSHSVGPVKQQHFTYTCLPTDTVMTLSPTALQSRVDYAFVPGVARSAADVLTNSNSPSAVITGSPDSGACIYTFTVTAATCAVGDQYVNTASGQLFEATASMLGTTILTALSLSPGNGTALGASGSLNRVTSVYSSTSATQTFSAVTVPVIYGSGFVQGI